MDSRERYLIKNTTREEREAIVRKSLGGGDCAGCSGCDGVSCPDGLEMYMPYIEGKKEIFEINKKIRGGTVS